MATAAYRIAAGGKRGGEPVGRARRRPSAIVTNRSQHTSLDVLARAWQHTASGQRMPTAPKVESDASNIEARHGTETDLNPPVGPLDKDHRYIGLLCAHQIAG